MMLVANRQKCEALNKRFNTKGNAVREELVIKAKETLGCSSFDDCKKFCQDIANRDKCRNFGQIVGKNAAENVMQKLKAAGICNTPDECRNVCQENPEKCPGFPKPPVRTDGSGASGSGQRPPFLKPGEFRPEIRPSGFVKPNTLPLRPELLKNQNAVEPPGFKPSAMTPKDTTIESSPSVNTTQ